ncbi:MULTISPECIES: UDP-N-acetylmuramoyl-tripeptide--D-alanyl-D-alanine ligase [Isoptericola]|uniref:UDP-N-acetylmuramoyl-tripeptide--D-alanyl-D- alanine ligase n=1 Tax=Isoptericola TaxID=254250 RepID=UPI00383B3E19
MIELTAAEVADATSGTLLAEAGVAVTGPVVVDSRLVEAGSLFVAVPGQNVDGHDFAAAAVAAGAALVLATRPVDGVPCVVVGDVQVALGELARVVLERVRAAAEVRVVAVTGSVGKTTTKDLLGQLLGPDVGPEAIVVPAGSFNNEIGLPLTVLRVTTATRVLVLEMGADAPGDITALTRLAPPDVGIVLAVGTAHLGRFGDVETIARTKGEMVEGVRPGGTTVLNVDDSRVAAMAARAAPTTAVVTFGTIPASSVRARDVVVDGGRARFTLTTADGSAPVTLRLVGAHHVTNALAAAAAALELGVPLDAVASRLSEAGPLSPHRMAVVERSDGVTIVDDSYNANPDSMRAALRTLAVMAGRTRRSVAVVGEMLELGDAARVEHDAIGRLAVRLNVKRLVVVGEGAYHVHEGAQQEGSWGEESVFVPDLEAAREVLSAELTEGDVVLVKASQGSGLWRLADQLVEADA